MNKMKLLISTIAMSFLLILPLVSAQGLLVRPAKLGTYYVTIPAFSDFVLEKSLTVGNRYDVDLNLTIRPNGNFSSILVFENQSLLLKPNETRDVKYTIRVSDPGIYTGGLVLTSVVGGKPATVAYLADILVVASQSSVPSLLYPVILLVALAVFGYFIYWKFSKKGKPRHGVKIMFFVVFSMFFLSFISSVKAADIAMLVNDRNNLDPDQEQRIKDILVGMGHDVTLIDDTVSFNYNNFDLIVVAGRPSQGTIGNWVRNVPVNDHPTIAIDSADLAAWGWTKNAGSSSLSSSDRQKIYVQKIHPLTNGYALDQKVYVHLIQGKPITDLVTGMTNLTFVGTAKNDGTGGVIAYANPNTILANGKKVGNKAAIVFFGVHYPNLWTEDGVQLFKNAVNWLTTLDFTPPSVPTLQASWKKGDTSITYSWNNITNAFQYELQISNSQDFSSVLSDQILTTNSFSYSPIQETQSYYARVRAYNNLNIFGNWSQVTKTVVDSSDMIISIVSPQSGITAAPGSTVFTNVTLKAQKMINGYNCQIFLNDQFVTNLTYNSTGKGCAGNVVLPSSMTGSLTMRASATNSVGTTNSTSVTFTVSSPASASSSSSSSGDGGGSGSIAIIGIDVPTELSAQEDSDYEFAVNVKNEGLIPLTVLKVSIAGTNFTSDIEPSLINLDIGQSRQFNIILHIPDNSVGTYKFDIRAISYETSWKKKVTLNVQTKPILPNIIISGKQIPEFLQGLPSLVSVSASNNGELAATGNAKIIVPENWTVDQDSTDFSINPGEKKTFSFNVVPINSTGKITFEISYLKNGREEVVSEDVDVVGMKKESPFSISGFLIQTFTNPLVGISILAGAEIVLGYFLRKELLKGLFDVMSYFRSRPTVAPAERTISSPRPVDFSRNYDKWERKHKFRGKR